MTPPRLRALLVGALAVAAMPVLPAGGADGGCLTTWADPAGDTVYNTGTGLARPAVADDDLDATAVSVRATTTSLVATVKVKRLNAAGPAVGTGHGVGLVVTKYGRTMAFAARRDATYGDAADAPDARSVVRLDVDEKAGTFVLTLRRSDLSRVAGSPSNGGDLTGIYVTTLRYDHPQALADKTPVGAGHAGLTADDTAPGDKGGTLSLDACDALLRRTTLRTAVSGTPARRTVTVTLRSGDGTPLPSQTVRAVAAGRTVATGRTDATGTARLTLAGARTVTVVYDGVRGVHDAARATVRL